MRPDEGRLRDPVIRWNAQPNLTSARFSAAASETRAGLAQCGVGWPHDFGSGAARAPGRATRCRARARGPVPALRPVREFCRGGTETAQ